MIKANLKDFQPKFIKAYSKQTNSSLSSLDAFLTGMMSSQEIFENSSKADSRDRVMEGTTSQSEE